MKIWLPIFFICALFVSCGNGNQINIPNDVLGRDTMAAVIADVHLVQASQRLGMVIDTADTGAFTSFNYVWKKHHITEGEYQKSLDFYSHHPDIFDSIYENVLNNLSKQRAELLGKRNLK